MSTPTAAWLAWLLCLLSVALAVASLILALLNGRTPGEIFSALGGPSIAAFPASDEYGPVCYGLSAHRAPCE